MSTVIWCLFTSLHNINTLLRVFDSTIFIISYNIIEEGDDMEHRQIHNDYLKAAYIFAILSIFGSLLSIINIIPLMIAYEMLGRAKKIGISKKHLQIINLFMEIGMLLTLGISILYISLRF